MNKQNILRIMLGLMCVLVVTATGCKRQVFTKENGTATFDCESAIKRIQNKIKEEPSFLGEQAGYWKGLRSYLSLLMRYRETQWFEADEGGYTALMYAVRFGTVDEVKGLISAGSDVNAKDNNGWTALLMASSSGTYDWTDINILEALISAGADVNAKTEYGYTALGFASMEGNEDLVKMLLSAGADVNGRGSCFSTALMEAVSQERTGTVKILLAAGADVNAKDVQTGETAWSWASRYGIIEDNPELAQLLRDAGAKEQEQRQ